MKIIPDSKFVIRLNEIVQTFKTASLVSGKEVAFWHPKITPSEYYQQKCLHLHPEYNRFFESYKILRFEYNEDLQPLTLDYFLSLLQGAKNNTSQNHKLLLQILEYFLIIEHSNSDFDKVCNILEDKITNLENDKKFADEIFVAVYLLISFDPSNISDKFLSKVIGLTQNNNFTNVKNLLLLSNFFWIALNREIVSEDQFEELVSNLDYLPLSATYNNFTQGVRLYHEIKLGSNSDLFMRKFNARILDRILNNNYKDFSLNGLVKLNNHWCGRDVTVKALRLLEKNKELNSNIFYNTMESALWFIFRNLLYLADDEIETPVTEKDLQNFSKPTLLKLAFISPGFSKIIGNVLSLPGLELIAKWNIFQTTYKDAESSITPFIRPMQRKTIPKMYNYGYLGYNLENLNRIEIDWFWLVYNILGEANFQNLSKYFSLPFTISKKRTIQISDCLTKSCPEQVKDIQTSILSEFLCTNKKVIPEVIDKIVELKFKLFDEGKKQKLKLIPAIDVYLKNTSDFHNLEDYHQLIFLNYPNSLDLPPKKILKPRANSRQAEYNFNLKLSKNFQPIIEVGKNNKILRTIPTNLRTTAEIKKLISFQKFTGANIENLSNSLEKLMSTSSFIKAEFWLSIFSSFYKPLLKNLVFTTSVETGFLINEGKYTFIDCPNGKHLVSRELLMKLALASDLHSKNDIHMLRKELVEKRLFQPFAQVYREIFCEDCYINNFDSCIKSWQEIKFSNLKFNESLRKKNWIIASSGKRRRYFKNIGLCVELDTYTNTIYPINSITDNIKEVRFISRSTNSIVESSYVPKFMKCVVLENIHFGLCNSSINDLELEFAPALVSFIVNSLQAQGWTNVEIHNNQLKCTEPNIENKFKEKTHKQKQISIDLEPFSILTAKTEEPKSKTKRYTPLDFSDNNIFGDYYPHPPSNFWETHLAAINSALSDKA